MRSVVGCSTALRGVTSGSQEHAERFRAEGEGESAEAPRQRSAGTDGRWND